MENKETELLKRAEDLLSRCEKSDTVTHTLFLTPAEQGKLTAWGRSRGCPLLFHGGCEGCERQAAFFLPDYLEPEYFDAADYLRAIRLTAHFGAPGHRDYLGALLAMGIGREWLGDILVEGERATVFCLPSVERHLLGIDRVGRIAVTAEAVPLTELSPIRRETESVTFTVMSPRLDAMVAGLFHLSRTEAARQITAGNVNVNYEMTDRADLSVREGDVLSLRGAGKGRITGTGGSSRKGRLFIYGEIYK